MTREEEIDLAWQRHLSQRQEDSGIRIRTKELRDQLAEQQNHRCPYCGVRMNGAGMDDTSPTFEHVLPRVLGGKDEVNNLVIACRRCNRERDIEMWPEHKEALCV